MKRSNFILYGLGLYLFAVGAIAADETAKVLGETKLAAIMPGIEAQILELKRGPGDTVTLKFRLKNTTGEKKNPIDKHFTKYDPSDVGKVSLVDYVNKKRYLVMKDSNNNCICSSDTYNAHILAASEAREFWAKFAAPPANITKISIILPGAAPFDDVPISN